MFKELRNKGIFLMFLTLSVVTLPLPLRINSICVVGLFVAWVVFTNTIGEKLTKLNNRFFFLFASLYLIHVIGLLWTSNIHRGLFELEKKSFLLVFPLILGSIPRLSREEIKTILKYFVISCLLVSIACLGYALYRTISSASFFETNVTTNYTTYYFFYFGLSDIFLHPVYFSAYIVFCFFIVSDMLMEKWKSASARQKGLNILLLIYLTGFLFLLSGRIMIIALFAISILYILYLFFKKGKLIFGIGISFFTIFIALLIIAVTPAIRERFEQLITSSYQFENNPETNKNLAGKLDGVRMRMAKWYFTVKAGEDSWLIGTGSGDDEDTLQQTYLKNNFMEGYVPHYNAHNQFLQTWLGLGVIGLLILLLNLLIPGYLAFREQNFLYFVFILIVFLFCLTESVFARQHGVAFYSVFNSLFAFHTLKWTEAVPASEGLK